MKVQCLNILWKTCVLEKSGSQDMGQKPQSGRGSWEMCLALTSSVPIPYGKSQVGNFYLIV